MGNDKDYSKLENELAAVKKENKELIATQQELKAKIKELTELPPKIVSGHKSGSVKYIRQKRA